VVSDLASRPIPALALDTITASRIANMKELRPPSAGHSEIRILLVFDPWRSVILLVAGDKSGQWDKLSTAKLRSPLVAS
jgi:hypothetical protein